MTMTFSELIASHCIDRRKKDAMSPAAVAEQLSVLPSWSTHGKRIERDYDFGDYWETIAFVNAIAFVANGEDHHPELVVGYDRIAVRFDTHTAGGISANDFICAAKVEALYANRPGRAGK